jgi:hypothetical protein
LAPAAPPSPATPPLPPAIATADTVPARTPPAPPPSTPPAPSAAATTLPPFQPLGANVQAASDKGHTPSKNPPGRVAGRTVIRIKLPQPSFRRAPATTATLPSPSTPLTPPSMVTALARGAAVGRNIAAPMAGGDSAAVVPDRVRAPDLVHAPIPSAVDDLHGDPGVLGLVEHGQGSVLCAAAGDVGPPPVPCPVGGALPRPGDECQLPGDLVEEYGIKDTKLLTASEPPSQ